MLPGSGLLPSVFPREEELDTCEELASFYEAQFVKRGVKIARGFEVERLWEVHEVGSFRTLEGPAAGLKSTMPRPVGKAAPQFKMSRGVVLRPAAVARGSDAADEAEVEGEAKEGLLVHLATRLTIVCSEPRPRVPPPFLPTLAVVTSAPPMPTQLPAPEPTPASSASAVGALLVDEAMRTTHSSGAVYAVGGCSCVVAKPQQSQAADDSHQPLPFHPSSPQNAAETARAVARVLLSEGGYSNSCTNQTGGRSGGERAGGSMIPTQQLAVLELSWKFSGSSAKAVPVLVGDTGGRPKFFACVWTRNNRLTGILLEGGTPEQQAVMAVIAREQPRIINIKKLRKCTLAELLRDPFLLEPPKLAPWQFVAELDDDAILEAFRYFENPNAPLTVKTSNLGALMEELGAGEYYHSVSARGLSMASKHLCRIFAPFVPSLLPSLFDPESTPCHSSFLRNFLNRSQTGTKMNWRRQN